MNKKIEILLKKILKKEDKTQISADSVPQPVCVGGSDFFEYKDGILYAEGWVFDTVYPMQNPMIAFYHEEKKLKEIRPSVIYRKDVAQILNNPEAEGSGFFFEAKIHTPFELNVYYEYSTSVGDEKFFLGTVALEDTKNVQVVIETCKAVENIGNIRYIQEHLEVFAIDKNVIWFQSLEKNQELTTILAFDHLLGGGASQYLLEKKKIALDKGFRFLTMRQDVKGPTYYLEYEYQERKIVYYERDLVRVLDSLSRIDEIWINELVTYINPYFIMESILGLKEKHGAYVKMLLHDYYAICPAVNLMNDQGDYCYAASEDICNQCIPKNRSNACLEYESGSVWRQKWGEFLRKCDEVCAFSKDTAQIFAKIYPELKNVTITPHKPHDVPAVKRTKKETTTFNIGLLGVLCYKKGLGVVKEMVHYIEKNHLNIKIKLIGISDEEIESDVFSYTGRYTLDQLPKLTLQEDIDLFFIPSIWPETFSYTTSEIISMDMPVAIFPIGAPVERVETYEKGLILSGRKPGEIIPQMWKFTEKIWSNVENWEHIKKI